MPLKECTFRSPSEASGKQIRDVSKNRIDEGKVGGGETDSVFGPFLSNGLENKSQLLMDSVVLTLWRSAKPVGCWTVRRDRCCGYVASIGLPITNLSDIVPGGVGSPFTTITNH
jgi:hypothetical protein